ncbi:Uma2 family endonuclease [Baaleninema simplex]|uniref:Uma2 family endonuclease n=1 Tax=Baaleninema simplex TaxID=2862350 RepID=UPI00034CE860|nr:Uma2 family endonuclease [Baaleninema simplex]
MIQTHPKFLNLEEFIDRYGDRDRYELIDGELIDLEPTGLHEQVISFISRKLNVEIDRLDLPYADSKMKCNTGGFTNKGSSAILRSFMNNYLIEDRTNEPSPSYPI